MTKEKSIENKRKLYKKCRKKNEKMINKRKDENKSLKKVPKPGCTL